METEIFFASNRDVKHETSSKGNLFGDRFNAMGPQCFRVGVAEARLTGDDPKVDEDWSVGSSKLFAETLGAVPPEQAQDGLGSTALFERLRRRLKEEDADVIVYIHGYANTFQNAVIRAAALQTLYGGGAKKAIVVMFSWPSDGVAAPGWSYFSDRDDAAASGVAMGRALKRLVEFLAGMRAADRKTIMAARRAGGVPDPDDLVQCTRRLHIVAHSMGNWALRNAVQKFVKENGGKAPRCFDNVFLMAADEDDDALAEALKLAPLTDLANRVFVYHAENDVALTVSDRTKGMPDRLGADGPARLMQLNERVMAIDCGRVSKTTTFDGRHQYYRLRDEVIWDVRATLAGVPQEDRAGRAPAIPGRSWRLSPG